MTKFYIKYPDPDNQNETLVEELFPQKLLTNSQVRKMNGRPQMILLFARYVADRVEQKHGFRPAVHVLSIGAVNYRVPQLMIDPTVDLASLESWAWINDFVFPMVPVRVFRILLLSC